MRQRLKQTEEESYYESSETNNLKSDWFSQHQPTFVFTYTTNVTTVTSGVASEKLLVMPYGMCPKLTRRHHGWRRARKFSKFRAPTRSSETAFSDIYLFMFVGTIWSINRHSNLIFCVQYGVT